MLSCRSLFTWSVATKTAFTVQRINLPAGKPVEINKPAACTITACAWSLSPIENVLDMKHSASTPEPFLLIYRVDDSKQLCNHSFFFFFFLSHQAPCCTSSYIYTGTRPWVTTLSIASKKTAVVLIFSKIQWCILSESLRNGFSVCCINCKTNQSFELMHCGVLAFIYRTCGDRTTVWEN